MANKKYFWLKLKEDFFRDKRIKKLRRIAGGDTYTIIYLKLQLLSLKNNGALIYEGVEPTLEEELALEIDEDENNVKVALAFMFTNGLIEETDPNHYIMTETIKCIGSESSSAERVRKHRELKAQNQKGQENTIQLSEPKTNAQRQKMFRAKKIAEEQQHIPLIEDYMNNKRYGGNYYLVLKRDAFKCAICNSTENLCVHHIDGYDENKPQNNDENKLITLCRCCHSNVHAGNAIPSNILESIDYYESNVTLPSNTQVTISNIEIEKEKEQELDEEKKKKSAKAPIVYFSTENLNALFIEFLELRKKLKAVNSDRAIKMLINKLNKYDDNTKIEMIERSILNSWKDVYEPKTNKFEVDKVTNDFDKVAEAIRERGKAEEHSEEYYQNLNF